jgi:hypothetical protein
MVPPTHSVSNGYSNFTANQTDPISSSSSSSQTQVKEPEVEEEIEEPDDDLEIPAFLRQNR